MVKRALAKKRVPPEAFGEHRRAAFARTVQLTQKALAQLQAQGRTDVRQYCFGLSTSLT